MATTTGKNIAIVTGSALGLGYELASQLIGCTGGQHRSVAMSEELARRLRAHGLNVTVSAREQTPSTLILSDHTARKQSPKYISNGFDCPPD